MPSPINQSRVASVYPRYTLVTHIKRIDPLTRTAEDCDILMMRESARDIGKIIAIEPNLKPSVTPLTRVRGSGLYACRGFVDLHTHICEPGAMYKEDIRTATASAAEGGYSDLLVLPSIPPAWNEGETLDYLQSNARARGRIPLHIAAYLTVRNQGEVLADLEGLIQKGAVAFYEEGFASPALLYEAMKRLSQTNTLLIYRADTPSISQAGDRKSALAAECMALSAALTAAALTGCRLHVTTLSSKAEVQLIRKARECGVQVTCDTAPQYFTLTATDLIYYGSLAKISPPLQSAKDREAIIEAIADGTIDCIVSDHTPETAEDKRKPFASAPAGMIGLQTAFALGMRELVLTGRIDLYRLIELLSTAPARILGLSDSLAIDAPSTVTLLDLSREYTLTESMLASKSKNCPWVGQSFQGTVKRNFARLGD